MCITCLCWSCRYAGGLLDEDIFQGKELVDSRPLQALVAGLKACSTWENIRCLQDCREGPGGTVSPQSPCHGSSGGAPVPMVPGRHADCPGALGASLSLVVNACTAPGV